MLFQKLTQLAGLATRAVRFTRGTSPLVLGTVFGASSAVLYTGANVALRKCVGVDPFLVAAVRAAPTIVFLGPVLAVMLARGVPMMSSGRWIPRFAAVALVGQFVGNAAFQFALQRIGLAASVPITLGVLIVGGALLGRLMLGEPVGPSKLIAMAVLVIAIVVLSIPNQSNAPNPPNAPEHSISHLSSFVGAGCAAASGAAYALFGVVMRQILNKGVSAALTMFISGAVGSLSLWSVAFARLGGEAILSTDFDQWGIMITAGIFNFSAFVSLSYALKMLPIVAVNLINASQVAMAAVAGVFLFAEPITASLISGVGLTFTGLMILTTGRERTSVQANASHEQL